MADIFVVLGLSSTNDIEFKTDKAAKTSLTDVVVDLGNQECILGFMV